MAFRLGRSSPHSSGGGENDNDFVSALATGTPVVVGQVWWVPLLPGYSEATAQPSAHRQHQWHAGRVVEVQPDAFVVLKDEVRHVVMSKQVPLRDVVGNAESKLRCVEWTRMRPDLLDLPERDAQRGDAEARVSRPVPSGASISFFISHSWHDSTEAKFSAVNRVAADFDEQHGRPATFWLDGPCLDPELTRDALRLLPLHVLACERLLILCGRTYPGRLSCIWELFVLLAFVKMDQVMDRLHLILLEGDCSHDVAMQLCFSSIAEARCEDPNEEARLRHTVVSVGEARFNARIKMLSDTLANSARAATALIVDQAAGKSLRMVASESSKCNHGIDVVDRKQGAHIWTSHSELSTDVSLTVTEGVRDYEPFPAPSSVLAMATFPSLLSSQREEGHALQPIIPPSLIPPHFSAIPLEPPLVPPWKSFSPGPRSSPPVISAEGGSVGCCASCCSTAAGSTDQCKVKPSWA